MNPQSAASAYARAAFESAPPLKIVHMLYEGAIRFLEQAEAMDPRGQASEFAAKLHRADAIVGELRINLDPSHAPDLVENLTSVYLFVEERIQGAFLEGTTQPLPAARTVLEILLEGWKELEVRGTGLEAKRSA